MIKHDDSPDGFLTLITSSNACAGAQLYVNNNIGMTVLDLMNKNPDEGWAKYIITNRAIFTELDTTLRTAIIAGISIPSIARSIRTECDWLTEAEIDTLHWIK
jgi:hypothetical protein